MNMKKILCLAIAMMMALCAAAFADTEADLQAKLDEANARIAELEALINEVYLPVYESQIVAEFGEDGVIWAADARAEYDYVASMYAQYGMSVDGYEDMIKQSVLDAMVEKEILMDKATELGLDVLSEEDNAAMAAEADAMFESYISTYQSYFAADGASEEEVRANTVAYLESAGITAEVLQADMVTNYIHEKLYDYAVEGVAVTDEDVKAAYEEKVAASQEDYLDEYTYNSDRTSGAAIAWNPEGYRAVKHVLVQFDDTQAALYNELDSALDSLTAEMEALENPEEAAEDAEPRTKEEIQADMQDLGVEIEGLYSQLLPEAQEVIDAFNAGTSFEDLIAKYNDDPGMQSEPIKTIGYAVSNQEGYWDPAFIKGAMAIEEVGQISQPVYGSYGIHIIYYMADITPGAVAFEEIADAVEAEALEAKIAETYNGKVEAWVEEADPVYYFDRF
ncbi:MAG: peptidylprolyl isomerase [Clostridia bacterium]|nr:peptidylprolyl isomerase [Clostridia bacterium]